MRAFDFYITVTRLLRNVGSISNIFTARVCLEKLTVDEIQRQIAGIARNDSQIQTNFEVEPNFDFEPEAQSQNRPDATNQTQARQLEQNKSNSVLKQKKNPVCIVKPAFYLKGRRPKNMDPRVAERTNGMKSKYGDSRGFSFN